MQGSNLDAKSAVPEDATPQKFGDMVEIVATESAKNMKPGKKYEVHRLQAGHLIKKGFAKKA